MSDERLTKIAYALLELGVSRKGVVQLMNDYEPDRIERQLMYLPHRRAKRPEAFIIEAIRHDYSAPKSFFHASPSA